MCGESQNADGNHQRRPNTLRRTVVADGKIQRKKVSIGHSTPHASGIPGTWVLGRAYFTQPRSPGPPTLSPRGRGGERVGPQRGMGWQGTRPQRGTETPVGVGPPCIPTVPVGPRVETSVKTRSHMRSVNHGALHGVQLKNPSVRAPCAQRSKRKDRAQSARLPRPRAVVIAAG